MRRMHEDFYARQADEANFVGEFDKSTFGNPRMVQQTCIHQF